MAGEKIDITKIEEKNIFRPMQYGDMPKVIPIPNPEGVEPGIDLFLDSLNLPESWRNEDCALVIHSSYRESIEKLGAQLVGENRKNTRYRDFLLIFEEDIPKSLFYVASIFDMIENLKRLAEDDNYEMSAREDNLLRYLRLNRFKRS